MDFGFGLKLFRRQTFFHILKNKLMEVKLNNQVESKLHVCVNALPASN
jgi:hypothetical protein